MSAEIMTSCNTKFQKIWSLICARKWDGKQDNIVEVRKVMKGKGLTKNIKNAMLYGGNEAQKVNRKEGTDELMWDVLGHFVEIDNKHYEVTFMCFTQDGESVYKFKPFFV